MRMTLLVALLVLAPALFPAPVSAQSSTPTCFGERATIVGTEGDDEIEGSDAPDVIVGLGGNDWIVGGQGRDRICGGKGKDSLDGNGGWDRLAGQEGYEHLSGGAGSDRLVGGRGNDKFWDWHGDDVLLGQHGHDVFNTTGPGDDRLVGGAGDDWFQTNAGDDIFDGGKGTDHADFCELSRAGPLGSGFGCSRTGLVIDLARGYAKPHGPVRDEAPYLTGGPGHDRLMQIENITGTGVKDFISGSSADNRINQGEGQHDIVRGRAGDDTLFQVKGAAFGGKGDDTLPMWNRLLSGGPGFDIAVGPFGGFESSAVTADLRSGRSSLFGAADMGARDYEMRLESIEGIWGSREGDSLKGGPGPNLLRGGSGNDVLDGRGGLDNLGGGRGTDSCMNGETEVGCE